MFRRRRARAELNKSLARLQVAMAETEQASADLVAVTEILHDVVFKGDLTPEQRVQLNEIKARHSDAS